MESTISWIRWADYSLSFFRLKNILIRHQDVFTKKAAPKAAATIACTI